MAFPSYPNSFLVSDKVDAPKFNENFDQIIDDLSITPKDINMSSANVATNVIVNNDFVADAMNINTDLDAQGAVSFSTNVIIDGTTYLKSIYAVSGTTIVSLTATDLSNEILSISQGFNKLLFPSAPSNVNIINISTASFEDGDIVTVINQATESGVTAISCMFINSDASGNLRCGSDLTLLTGENMTFIYNGIQNTFDLLSSNRQTLDFFS